MNLPIVKLSYTAPVPMARRHLRVHHAEVATVIATGLIAGLLYAATWLYDLTDFLGSLDSPSQNCRTLAIILGALAATSLLMMRFDRPAVRVFLTLGFVVGMTLVRLPYLDEQCAILRFAAIWLGGVVFATQLLTYRKRLAIPDSGINDLKIVLFLPLLLLLTMLCVRNVFGSTQLRLPTSMVSTPARPDSYSSYTYGDLLSPMTHSDLLLTRTDAQNLKIDFADGDSPPMTISLNSSPAGIYTDGSLIRFSPDKTRVVIAFGEWLGVYQVSRAAGPASLQLTQLFVYSPLKEIIGLNLIRHVEILSDDRTIICTRENWICSFDIVNRKELGRTQLKSGNYLRPINDVNVNAVSPDEKKLAASYQYGADELSLPTLSRLRRIYWDEPIGAMAPWISPDGNDLIVPLPNGNSAYVIPLCRPYWLLFLLMIALLLCSIEASNHSLSAAWKRHRKNRRPKPPNKDAPLVPGAA